MLKGMTLEHTFLSVMKSAMKQFQTITVLMFCLFPISVLGKGVYMTPEDFVAESFASTQPLIQSLWFTDDIRDNAKQIFNHAYPGLRIRYWYANERGSQRTAWIMDEIGKTRPITIGITIAGDQIERVRILEFRESRGAEVRMPFFTRQFVGLTLQPSKTQLSGNIDGITGATLSVKAVKKTARFALFLHRLVTRDETAGEEVGSKMVVLP